MRAGLATVRVGLSIIAICACYLLLMAGLMESRSYSAVIIMIPLSLGAFAAQVYLFRSLVRSLKMDKLAPALSLAHVTFVCLFTPTMCHAIQQEPIHGLVWYGVILVIDFPAFFLTSAVYDLFTTLALGYGAQLPELSNVQQCWALGLALLVIGTLQWHLIGRFIQQRSEARPNSEGSDESPAPDDAQGGEPES
jgi:hypothetical protein